MMLNMLLQALMVELVIAAAGHTCGKAPLEFWLLQFVYQRKGTSPVTGDFLSHKCTVLLSSSELLPRGTKGARWAACLFGHKAARYCKFMLASDHMQSSLQSPCHGRGA